MKIKFEKYVYQNFDSISVYVCTACTLWLRWFFVCLWHCHCWGADWKLRAVVGCGGGAADGGGWLLASTLFVGVLY